MTSSPNKLRPGDEISIPWGLTRVKGIVEEVYGPAKDRRVLVLLTPEVSGVVSEPTTVSVHHEDVERVKQAS